MTDTTTHGILISDSSDQDYESGDEYRTWSVFEADEDGDPVGKSYTTRSRDHAHDLALKMARDRHLPFDGYA